MSEHTAHPSVVSFPLATDFHFLALSLDNTCVNTSVTKVIAGFLLFSNQFGTAVI